MRATLPDNWLFRVKAATRDLATLAGGIERAAELTGHSKSVVGRWQSPTDGDLITLTAAAMLERDAQKPLVTGVMAEIQGFRLASLAGHCERTDFMRAHAQFCRANADLQACVTEALADGVLTPNERREIDREIGDAIDKLNGLRAANAEGAKR